MIILWLMISFLITQKINVIKDYCIFIYANTRYVHFKTPDQTNGLNKIRNQNNQVYLII